MVRGGNKAEKQSQNLSREVRSIFKDSIFVRYEVESPKENMDCTPKVRHYDGYSLIYLSEVVFETSKTSV